MYVSMHVGCDVGMLNGGNVSFELWACLHQIMMDSVRLAWST